MTFMDIRDKPGLSGDEVRQLSFIKASRIYEFRKYYRSGLRSHIFEVLDTRDVQRETAGVMEEGIRIYPRAVPRKMFRIFRSRFASKEEIFQEIQRYQILLHHLGPKFIARSEEFIADYREAGQDSILLCGLQEYVQGEILDPWRLNGPRSLTALLSLMAGPGRVDALTRTALDNVRCFTRGIRHLIHREQVVPDLAGVGNLILTPEGEIRLVDINNIVAVTDQDEIPLDDKGYPACDVSIQVLFILEAELLGTEPDKSDPLFTPFLSRQRRERVRQIERDFYKQLG